MTFNRSERDDVGKCAMVHLLHLLDQGKGRRLGAEEYICNTLLGFHKGNQQHICSPTFRKGHILVFIPFALNVSCLLVLPGAPPTLILLALISVSPPWEMPIKIHNGKLQYQTANLRDAIQYQR